MEPFLVDAVRLSVNAEQGGTGGYELTERGNELQPDSDPSGFVDEVGLPRPRLDRTVTPEVGRPSQVRQITSVRPISRAAPGAARIREFRGSSHG